MPEHIAAATPTAPTQLVFEVGTTLDEIELRVIRETLRHAKGDKSLAAQLLGISTRTIYRKLGVTSRRDAIRIGDRRGERAQSPTMRQAALDC